jgi:uncharacterized SAM-binding protein YcdF (DUF218 family)
MKQKLKLKPGWIAVIGLILVACVVRVVFSGYRFSAYIMFGCAGVISFYLLLPKLAKMKPKLAKVLAVGLSLCLGFGIVAAAVTGVIVVRAAGGQDVSCDYIVVLGAGVNGTRPSLSLQERIDAAYDYLVAYPNAVCIVSGGQGNGENITEAQCMYNELTAMGIETDRIWLEQRATNTRDNIRFSLDIIEGKTGTRPDRIGLVSSEYHLYRAGLFARSENVIANGIPAKTSWVTLRINYFLREIVAVWYYTLLGG